MSYEEKYKEALKRADSLTEKYGGREFAEYVFPELAESEDERIRQEIIHYLVYTAGGLSAEEQNRWIAYLEKQKNIEDRWIEDRGQCFWNGVEEGKMLAEKQKEQKPAEWSEDAEQAAARYERENRQSVLSSVDIVNAFIEGARWKEGRR